MSKVELLTELSKRDEEIRALRQENALLRQKVDALVRRCFGASSEKLDPAQLELLLFGERASAPQELAWVEAAALPPKATLPKRTPSPRGRARWPQDLPVVEEVIEPEEITESPQSWRRIGEEINEQLDYDPARFFRRRTVRPKYVEIGALDAAPVIAELPASLLERGTAAPGLIAQIVVAKYCDHLPLYRQEQIYQMRHGVWLPRQNLATWVGLAAEWLKPVYDLIKTDVLKDGYVQVDETPIEYLEPGNGQTKQGYFWAVCRPQGGVFFQWETSRAAACLENIIPFDFGGVLQSDGYSAYGAFTNGRAEIEQGACMAHIRRGFYEAKDQAGQTVGFVLKQIQNLYAIEEKLRKNRAGPGLRQSIREAESRPIFERLKKVFIKIKGRYLPKSALGKAITHALSQWPRMEVWLRDGRIEIDNNLVENAIRPTALGKKNWLFIGDANAGQTSAILYTIIENCRRLKIDPFTYLRDALTRLPSMTNWHVKDITPEAWAKALRGEVPRKVA